LEEKSILEQTTKKDGYFWCYAKGLFTHFCAFPVHVRRWSVPDHQKRPAGAQSAVQRPLVYIPFEKRPLLYFSGKGLSVRLSQTA
jgi:hypothetical protein